MESVINKLFEYYDHVFFRRKSWSGSARIYGDSLWWIKFRLLLEDSILGIDYLSILDIFGNIREMFSMML